MDFNQFQRLPAWKQGMLAEQHAMDRGMLAQAEELAQQRNAKYGMLRPEPSLMQRIGGQAKRLFFGDKNMYGNDPLQPSVMDSQYVRPEMAEGAVLDVVGGPMAVSRQMAKGMLNQDEILRMARAKDMGYGVDAYHGSTRDISEFTNKYGNPQGHYGGNVHYFTGSADDLSKNYSGEGPDLTSRIEREVEQLDAMSFDEYVKSNPRYDELRWQGKPYTSKMTPESEEDITRILAKERLGIESKGVSYPVKLKMQNPVKTHGKDETFFDYQAKFDDDPTSPYYEEFIGEEGRFIELLDETKKAMREWDVYKSDEVMGKLQEANMDMEGITASQFEDVIRNNVHEIYHPVTGELASSGEMIADIYKRMGYDGVEMDAYKAFGPQKGEGYTTKGMEGLDQDTRHYIVFEPHQIRSKFAEFDPKKSKSGNILAGGTAIALPVLSERE